MAVTRAAAERNSRRTRRRLFLMTLVAQHPVSANTTRFTFTAPEFADFSPLGPDEFFALVVPPAGAEMPLMAVADDEDPREALLAIDESRRPAIRWYTVRAHRPDRSEVDVDIVLHGDTGPASTWANHAQVGDRVGFREANAAYLAPMFGHQLIMADETALPALAAILEGTPAALDATVLVEVPGSADVPAIDSATPIRWLFRGECVPGTAALPALSQLITQGLPRVAYAWLCGESGLATGARRQVVHDLGVEPESIMFSGYWKLGQARR